MAGKIKVLGLNFGRVNGECKKYLNIALEEAKAAGAETEIIDTVTKKNQSLYRMRSLFQNAGKRKAADQMHSEG